MSEIQMYVNHSNRGSNSCNQKRIMFYSSLEHTVCLHEYVLVHLRFCGCIEGRWYLLVHAEKGDYLVSSVGRAQEGTLTTY